LKKDDQGDVAWRLFGLGAVIAVTLSVCSGAGDVARRLPALRRCTTHQGFALYATLAPPLLVAGMVLGNALATGLTSRMPGEQDRETMARGNAYGLLFIFGWLTLCAIVLVVPRLLFGRPWLHGALGSLGAAAGWFTASRLHATVGLAAALVLLMLVMGRYINVNTFSPARHVPQSPRARLPRGVQAGRAQPHAEPRHQPPPRLAAAQGRELHRHPPHAGNNDLGYRDAARYGGRDGISLGGGRACEQHRRRHQREDWRTVTSPDQEAVTGHGDPPGKGPQRAAQAAAPGRRGA
jgi:hypothetical protein